MEIFMMHLSVMTMRYPLIKDLVLAVRLPEKIGHDDKEHFQTSICKNCRSVFNVMPPKAVQNLYRASQAVAGWARTSED